MLPADVAIYCRVCQHEKGLSQPATDAQLYGWQPRTLNSKEAEAFPAVSTTAVSFRQAVVRDMSCRVERVEASLVTRDSGIRALFDVGTRFQEPHFGLIQDILEVSTAPECRLGYCYTEVLCLCGCTTKLSGLQVHMSGKQRLVFRVKWFQERQLLPSGLYRVKRNIFWDKLD